MTKAALRLKLKAERKALDPQQKTDWDSKICQLLIDFVRVQEAQRIHCYLPMAEEIQLWPFLQDCLDGGIEVQVPHILENGRMDSVILKDLEKLEPTSFGTWLPEQAIKAEHDPQIIVCPGLAFTEKGDRLGYGGGYYDRFLADHHDALRVGTSYPFQLIESIKTVNHDMNMDIVLFPGT